MQATVHTIEDAYRAAIRGWEDYTADALVTRGMALFSDIKLEGLADFGGGPEDMLLFQYGVWDWGDENGRHFSLDITRQFFVEGDDEPYQLALELIYDAASFEDIEADDCFSEAFVRLEDFEAHVRSTDGYRRANAAVALKCALSFSQM